GIASFEMFNTLSLGAREINGLWGMAPIPGILKEDGTIDNSEAGAGTAAVIFKNAGNPQSCYEFLDWWTGDDVQIEFCRTLENTLGPGGRYATANINAFNSQPWTRQQLSLLNTQRKMVQELPEIPGSYYVSRSIDNAFRAVLFDKKNPRETFQKENRSINREIERKRRELGLS
ncbi:MAG: ABC transporter substrate-binding protein, partial [Oscillospiraceae bacterium]